MTLPRPAGNLPRTPAKEPFWPRQLIPHFSNLLFSLALLFFWPTSILPTDFYLPSFYISLHAPVFLPNLIFFWWSILKVSLNWWSILKVSLNWWSILKVPRPHLASSSQMAPLPIWPAKWEKEFLLLFSEIS